MNIQRFQPIYFEIKKERGMYTLTEKTGCNYVHILMILFCFICCFANFTWLVILPLILYTISMFLKNCIFANACKAYPKRSYELSYDGSKYSFKEPKTYTIKRKDA